MADSRLFRLVRHDDVHGVSGTGIVADGTVYPDGTVTVRWRGEGPSTVVWDSIETAISRHGHDGKTTVAWAAPAVWPE